MKIRLIFFYVVLTVVMPSMVLWANREDPLVGDGKPFNALGILYPGQGNPSISVKRWVQLERDMRDSIKLKTISIDSWPTGNSIYIIWQQHNSCAVVQTFVFDNNKKVYTEQKSVELLVQEISDLSLDNCSYCLYIPKKLNHDFLRACISLMRLQRDRSIPIAIHYNIWDVGIDSKNIISTLVGNNTYAVINDEKIEKIMCNGKEISTSKNNGYNKEIGNNNDYSDETKGIIVYSIALATLLALYVFMIKYGYW